MKGDFSMERFNPAKHYNRVLKQQGRVDLDSDWNEQAGISQYLLRTLIVDLLGPAGGPDGACGFDLVLPPPEDLPAAVGDFVLGEGRYYVDGLLVENDAPVSYSAQPDLPSPPKLNTGKTYLAYLDVWERHISYIEDDSIREVALNGPDTCTRAKTLWQVKLIEAAGGLSPAPKDRAELEAQIKEVSVKLDDAKKALEQETNRTKQATLKRNIAKLEKQLADLRSQLETGGTSPEPIPPTGECGDLLVQLEDWESGTMAAWIPPADASDTPCVLPPESRYRGLENHLYRVEVHNSGDTGDANHVPTFKWSRENGSIVTRWLGTTGNDLRVGSSRGFAAGQWVELTSDADDLLGQPGPLTRITRIDGDILTVESAPAWNPELSNPKVRRWDQTANDNLTLVDGAIPIVPGTFNTGWIAIEDGIAVQFSAGNYRNGDYWLIPARVATGAIDWPSDSAGNPLPREPRGIEHHYAPLFMVKAVADSPFVSLVKDCRCRFAPLPCIGA